MDTPKIVTVCKFNDGEALALDSMPETKYQLYNGDTIIGRCGMFYVFYQKGSNRDTKAFAGRKFDLTMEDGTVVNCSGQWWSAISPTARKVLSNIEIIDVTVNSVDSLNSCYCYRGWYADKAGYNALRATYTGQVYGYHEAEKVLHPYVLADDKSFYFRRFFKKKYAFGCKSTDDITKAKSFPNLKSAEWHINHYGLTMKPFLKSEHISPLLTN